MASVLDDIYRDDSGRSLDRDDDIQQNIPLLNTLNCIARSMNILALSRSIGMEDFPLSKT